MSQTKAKRDSLVFSRSNLWMVWRLHAFHVLIVILLLILEPMVRKHSCMRATSVAVMGFFLESGILKVTWSQLCSKSLLSNYEVHRQLHFEWYPTVLYFFRTWINMRAKSFIKTSVNVTETRIDEGAPK